MEAIKETIKNILEDLGEKNKKPDAFAPETLFKKFLTKTQLRHIKPTSFRRGILNVSVDSSSWLYQFSLQKEELLTKLNAQSKLVQDIRFRLGEV